MMGERQIIQTARMLLLAATVIVALASASAANDQRQLVRFYNGNVVPHTTAMSNAMDAAAARVSPLAGSMAQQGADDRSLIIPKVLALKAIKKHKKHKKGKKKNPFKGFPGLFPLFGGAALASAATAATAATSAAATGAKGAAPVHTDTFGPTTYTAHVPENMDMPVWKVHKYNGIDIRPVRLSDIIPLPPPSELVEYKEVTNEAPKEVIVPAPVYGPPQETYPKPADTVVFPETSPPAQTYGVPAQTYGVPAQNYGVPAQTYGVPGQTYTVPAQTYTIPAQTYVIPSQGYAVPAQQAFKGPISQPSSVSTPEEFAPPADEAATAEGLEALSNLGALTDLIPGGADSSSLLPGLLGAGGAGNQNRGVPFSFFNRFIRGPQSAAQTAEASAEEAIFRQPPQSTIQNLLGRIPIISSLTNFGSANPATHVNIPPLPELPALPDIQNVRGPNVQIPQIPHIRLPTRYVVKGMPYISIRTPSQPAATPFNVEGLPAPTPEPVAQSEAPAVEPVKPEPSYPLPLEQPQPQPQPQYGLVNSYGQPVQTGYYVTPVVGPPAPPQFTVPIYPTSVAVPAAQYGLPGGDSSVAASETDPVTECGDDKACAQSVLKVVVPEEVTRAASKPQTPAAPSPVFKKSDVKEVSMEKYFRQAAVPEGVTRMVNKPQTPAAASPVFKKDVKEVPLEDMTKYLDPRHVAAPKTQTASPVKEGVDAQPSTNTDDDEVESS